MARPQTQLEALSPGQLAKRWGLGVDRVRQLVTSGHIPGAFRIPAAGRYGETIKIPLAAVLEREQEWAIASKDGEPRRKRRQQPDGSPALRHFPELRPASPPLDVESPSDDPH
jgi:hypothetical protein